VTVAIPYPARHPTAWRRKSSIRSRRPSRPSAA
jgi:hypothetical protein